MKTVIWIFVGVFAIAGAGMVMGGDNEGWVDLIQGDGLEGWRGYQMETVPPGWSLEDGVIVSVPEKGTTDLITEEQFGDFELVVEWKIGEGGNSGIMYRVSEEGVKAWHSAVEIQILDNDRHKDKTVDLGHAAGAVYALWPAKKEAFRDHGEWNETRIVAKGKNIEVYLNGVEIVKFEVGSDEWKEKIAASKFAKHPGLGELEKGHIVLQAHGSNAWFRNLKIREL
ncbi:MAG: DUF1080 domain-containing protein [Verrucomicrobiota bacterium]